MEKIKNIYDECELAVLNALNKLMGKDEDSFLLLLSRAELVSPNDKLERVTDILLDYRWDLKTYQHQHNFITRYLERNYSTEGFSYSTEIDVDDLILEMLIYSHIWEDIGFLKILMRLSHLLESNEYLWETQLESHKRMYNKITEQIIPPLRTQGLKLAEIVDRSYCSQLRNSFAHTMYSIEFDKREILIWGNQPEPYMYYITFDDFQQKFLYTAIMWNHLFKYFEQFRNTAATEKMYTNWIQLPEGFGYLHLKAKFIDRGDWIEPGFEGVISRNTKD